MQYITIKDVCGKEIRISKFIHGSPSGRPGRSMEETFRVMDRYRELGGNAFDLARFYGYPILGLREAMLCEYLRSRECRDQVVVITKGGMNELYDDTSFKRYRINREAILGDFYTSCDTLQASPIDVFLLHRDDPSQPVSRIMDVLQEVVDTGLVRAIGVSNWSVRRIREANDYAAARSRPLLSLSEIQWSYAYLDHAMRKDDTVSIMCPELYRQYEDYPIPILAYSCQAFGLFSYLYDGRETWETLSPARAMYDCPQNRRKMEKIRQYCDAHDVSPAALITAYLACNKVNCAPIFGCKTMEQLEDTMGGAELILDQDSIDWLDDISR